MFMAMCAIMWGETIRPGLRWLSLFSHRGTAKSTIGTVEGKEYELKLYWYKLCSLQEFRIAYCDFFDPAEADTLHQTCVGFVRTVRDFMPSLLRKQKVHYILHLVESMENYGPTSAFGAEG